MKQWEYETFWADNRIHNCGDFLKELGLKGWETYQKERDGEFYMGYHCKRPKQSDLMRFLRHMVEYYYENGGVNTQLMEKLDAMIEDE